jgi:hypothetical protein
MDGGLQRFRKLRISLMLTEIARTALDEEAPEEHFPATLLDGECQFRHGTIKRGVPVPRSARSGGD